MKVEGTHPLAEVILRKLFGIESCPPEEQSRMIQRACKASVEWHEKQIVTLETRIENLRKNAAHWYKERNKEIKKYQNRN